VLASSSNSAPFIGFDDEHEHENDGENYLFGIILRR
jgi:hypothetical protein